MTGSFKMRNIIVVVSTMPAKVINNSASNLVTLVSNQWIVQCNLTHSNLRYGVHWYAKQIRMRSWLARRHTVRTNTLKLLVYGTDRAFLWCRVVRTLPECRTACALSNQGWKRPVFLQALKRKYITLMAEYEWQGKTIALGECKLRRLISITFVKFTWLCWT